MASRAMRDGARFAAPRRLAVVDPAVHEASGIAVSRRHAGVVYTHNDQGGDARVFAVDSQSGAIRGELRLAGVEARDFEDIAIAAETIYVGDIGDNDRQHHSIFVLRFAEPAIGDDGVTIEIAADAIERLELRYPKRPRDCETLCVDPRSGDLVLVSKGRKKKGTTHVYRAPAERLTPAKPCQLERVARLRLGEDHLAEATAKRVTGGDMREHELVLRTRDEAMLWQRLEGEDLAATLGRAPQRVALAGRDQGEAIAFDERGGLYTLAEGESEPLFYFERLR